MQIQPDVHRWQSIVAAIIVLVILSLFMADGFVSINRVSFLIRLDSSIDTG